MSEYVKLDAVTDATCRNEPDDHEMHCTHCRWELCCETDRICEDRLAKLPRVDLDARLAERDRLWREYVAATVVYVLLAESQRMQQARAALVAAGADVTGEKKEATDG